MLSARGKAYHNPLMKYLELPYVDDAATLFTAFAHLPYAVFFDSGQPYDQRERYSMMTAKPSATILINHQDASRDPFELMKAQLQPYQALTCPDEIKTLPFKLGAIGYFSYDLGYRYFNLKRQTMADITLPDAVIGIYDWSIIIDHNEKKTWLLFKKNNSGIVDYVKKLIKTHATKPEPFKITSSFQANFTFDHYAHAFEKIKHHIYQGNCYQVNLCQRFAATYRGSLWHAYQQLRRINPAPFAIYMNLNQQAILSLSPERFLKVNNGAVETKPIKGTMARAKNERDDQRLKQQLQSSEKDRAENLMIVDLLRHDLSKCCRPHSIQVPQFAQLETFPQVHHLVSTITGQLKPSMHALDLWRHCFPGGSITGAPKKSAMRIIDSLEPHHRSVYCGSIGYVSYDGDMDCNIAIRTLIADHGKIYCYGGGGIVADSELTHEYQESITKISNLMETLVSL